MAEYSFNMIIKQEAEAVEQGFDVRWNCSKEEGERLYRIYQKRFPVIENDDTKNVFLNRQGMIFQI